jgi:hypothetical protein
VFGWSAVWVKFAVSARRRQQAAQLNAGSGSAMLPNLFKNNKINESHMGGGV